MAPFIDRDGYLKHIDKWEEIFRKALAEQQYDIIVKGMVMEFDHAKNQMILKRSGRERVFTKEN